MRQSCARACCLRVRARRPQFIGMVVGGVVGNGPAIERLQQQLGAWAADGMPSVKMKVGRDPAADPARVRAAREAVGHGVELFVDANGAYARKQALDMAGRFEAAGVRWFEEPVSSD